MFCNCLKSFFFKKLVIGFCFLPVHWKYPFPASSQSECGMWNVDISIIAGSFFKKTRTTLNKKCSAGTKLFGQAILEKLSQIRLFCG